MATLISWLAAACRHVTMTRQHVPGRGMIMSTDACLVNMHAQDMHARTFSKDTPLSRTHVSQQMLTALVSTAA